MSSSYVQNFLRMSREFCQCFGQSVDVSGPKKMSGRLHTFSKIILFDLESKNSYFRNSVCFSNKKQNSGRNFANDVDGFILPLPKQQSLPNDSSNWNIEPVNNVNWFCFYLLDLTFCGNLKHTLRNKEIFQRPKRNQNAVAKKSKPSWLS